MEDIRRVAVVFDDQLRPETTGTYCRRAIESLVQVSHFRPSDLDKIHSEPFDLFLCIDDGLDYRLPPSLRPAAYWAIDTHIDFDAAFRKAHDFDFVFAAQRDGAARLRLAGIASAVWLPLACDPKIHRKHDVAKQYDIAFVGNELPGERADLLTFLKRKFLNSFVGQRYFDDMARTYSAARMVFNRSVRNDINMRVFEALACGSMLITNDLADNGQAELFGRGVHLETYRDRAELYDKIRYYLDHPESRERIAGAGREEVIAKHTYRHRMQVVLDRVREERVQGSGFRASECRRAGVQGREFRSQRAEISDQQSELGSTASTHSSADSRIFSSSSPSTPATASTPSTSSTVCPDRSYFDHVRPELLALVPETARRVLDIGCGAGRLGQAIKKRQHATVVGIEIDQSAAAAARERIDQVLMANVELLNGYFEPGSFDCVVCGDILEHLEDAEELLRRVRMWLASGGRIVASIPNVRHHSIIRSLLDGNWTYESAGLLDRDHIRFFTRREIEKLFENGEFTIEQIQYVPGPGYDDWARQGRPNSVKIGRLHIGGLTTQDAEEFYVYQFLVVATPRLPVRRCDGKE